MDFNLVSLEFDDSKNIDIIFYDAEIIHFPGVDDLDALNNSICLKEIVN